MQKKLLIVSVILNFILCLITALVIQSNSLNYKTAKFIDQQRVADTKILEKFIIGRISKPEVWALLKANYSENDFFDKPSENAISAGSLLLVFDKDDMLARIELPYFDGP